MLQEIKIQNLAVVEDAVIRFDHNLNVLTGSTGAGKSIILTAVQLLSGGRARRSLLRKGAEKLVVEGVFTISPDWEKKERLGMDQEDESLSVKRQFTAGGKSKLWINGILSTNAAAAEITESLIELHGQHRTQDLLDPANHIYYLDNRGDYRELLEECEQQIERYQHLMEKLEFLKARQQKHREQEDFLQFQLSELEELQLEPGMEEDIRNRIHRLENIHKYSQSLEELHNILSDSEDSAIDRLAHAEHILEYLSSIDSSWENARSGIGEARIAVQENARRIEGEMGDSSDQPEDLEKLQQKLASIQRLCRKYRMDSNQLVKKREELRKILSSLKNGSDEILDVKRELKGLRGILVPMLEKLSRQRRKAAEILDSRMTGELKSLGMEGALFKTEIESTPAGKESDELDLNINTRGWDKVTFLIRTNVGEDINHLSEVASGGELSRITLILKKLQVEKKGIPILIFDEIDSGLGADLGEVVADKLASLADRYQIICISHLPHIAARATQHIKVQKKIVGGRTSSTAEVLSDKQKITEIARMLGGKGKLREELAGKLIKEG